MAQVSIFHNISRDASFGLNTTFRTGTKAPEGVRSVPLSDGRVTWKDCAQSRDEQHPLVWVFQYEAQGDDEEILCEAFETFNNGSGRENKRYFDRKLRSLSVGDVVVIDGRYHSCEGRGWASRKRSELHTLTADQAVPVIRSRYEFRPQEELACTVPLVD